ncbi:phytanoyl-CoA dioxygenase family protein [Actibacterium sp. 188UL27-1]|uniref:phytanoyl-CoA dioxygenase family protein n=1 Tax=Actibacterium sp. 188UL27-1 TaxID=2786961 RepID=UPI0019589683|nr:phytanoyl-CoA dioxygenase family protein [Actibacterium sp. 188UL27-1]MBM7069728.1 phytanoyl-CoA dioxygenase family protein [Actibacterium sp. 188UL27-1]
MKDQQILASGYYDAQLCDLGEFAALVSQRQDPANAPNAATIEKNIPIYDIPAIASQFARHDKRRELMAEWAAILQRGAGVFVLKQAQPDHAAIDAATAVYGQIINIEKEASGGADHFATAGSNDRIWNALQKLCTAAPDTFIRYFASPAMDAASEAWLGPNYQMTAQINVVHPGGKAQSAHRDYHLGFQTAEVGATYPAHVHDLSPLMTLQGGLAHCDMSVESGPTKFLPFSQLYRPGYMAWRRDDFRAYFEENYVQLPLQKGDALFFNPALFHAAGENRSSDIHRMVNLFQVSSPFGRAMESVDRRAMCKTLSAPLAAAWQSGDLEEEQFNAVIAATAEGYAFPTNLDRDPPADGLAPESQAALLKRAILSNMPNRELHALFDQQSSRRRP